MERTFTFFLCLDSTITSTWQNQFLHTLYLNFFYHPLQSGVWLSLSLFLPNMYTHMFVLYIDTGAFTHPIRQHSPPFLQTVVNKSQKGEDAEPTKRGGKRKKMLHDSRSVRRWRGRKRLDGSSGGDTGEGWGREGLRENESRQVDLGCCISDRAVSPWLWNLWGEQTGLGITKHQNKEGERWREKRKRQSVTDRLWAWVSERSVWRLKIGLNHTRAPALQTQLQSEGFTPWRQTGKLAKTALFCEFTEEEYFFIFHFCSHTQPTNI